MTHIVMLLSNSFRPDPRVLKEAVSLADLGYVVTVVCWDRANEMPGEEAPHPAVHIIRIQHIPSTYGVGARQILRIPLFWQAIQPWLDRLNPDLVHCHDFDTLPAGLWWGRRHHRPVVYDAHEYYADLCKPRLKGLSGNLLYRLIRQAERIGARLSSGIVTVDETLGNLYRQYHQKILIVGHYPGLSLAAQPTPVFTRPQCNLVYVGRLSQDRGLLFYADMLRFLLDAGIPARLTLAGVFTPQSDEQSFFRHSKDLVSAIQVTGWVPYHQIPALLHQGDVGLSILMPEPRYVAALPVKLFEYMATGLPVLASNFPATAQIVQETSCGVLVDPQASPQIAANQIIYWWHNPEYARQAGENGRQAILQKYNWETLVQQLDQFYRTLM